jgi:hypothetical protein
MLDFDRLNGTQLNFEGFVAYLASIACSCHAQTPSWLVKYILLGDQWEQHASIWHD